MIISFRQDSRFFKKDIQLDWGVAFSSSQFLPSKSVSHFRGCPATTTPALSFHLLLSPHLRPLRRLVCRLARHCNLVCRCYPSLPLLESRSVAIVSSCLTRLSCLPCSVSGACSRLLCWSCLPRGSLSLVWSHHIWSGLVVLSWSSPIVTGLVASCLLLLHCV